MEPSEKEKRTKKMNDELYQEIGKVLYRENKKN